jgi:hypothetical protein
MEQTATLRLGDDGFFHFPVVPGAETILANEIDESELVEIRAKVFAHYGRTVAVVAHLVALLRYLGASADFPISFWALRLGKSQATMRRVFNMIGDFPWSEVSVVSAEDVPAQLMPQSEHIV